MYWLKVLPFLGECFIGECFIGEMKNLQVGLLQKGTS